MSSLPPLRQLRDEQVQAVRTLARAIEAADGAPPLSDQALVQLSSDSGQIQHFLLPDSEGLPLGYAQIAHSEHAANAELAVAAEGDRAARTAALLTAVEPAAAGTPLLVWSHGTRSPIGPVLAARGYAERRTLLQLARSLPEAMPKVDVPGVRIQTFRVGADEDAWLTVNARAFAEHAEQANLRISDLLAREAADWFDPAGFLLAVDEAGALLGFHWTKVHPAGDGSPPVGEVYVLGVDPAAQGRRLGAALLNAGLNHLYERGVRQVMLYADDANTRAVQLYERSGFTVTGTDTQYQRAVS